VDTETNVSDATNKTGFCAVKLTALGRPQLLVFAHFELLQHECLVKLLKEREKLYMYNITLDQVMKDQK